MTDRVFIDGTNIVVSKTGHSASNPALADANKVFDSDWFFGGCILERKAFTFTVVGSATTYTMNFNRTYNFVPMVMCFKYAPVGGVIEWDRGFGHTLTRPFLGTPDNVQIYNNRVTKTFTGSHNGNYGSSSSDPSNRIGWYVLVMGI